MKKTRTMVWVKDQRNPDKPAFKTTEKSFKLLQKQRARQNYENDAFIIVDDPDYPEILVHPKGRYDLKKAREIKGEVKEEIILTAQQVEEKEKEKPKRTYKKK